MVSLSSVLIGKLLCSHVDEGNMSTLHVYIEVEKSVYQVRRWDFSQQLTGLVNHPLFQHARSINYRLICPHITVSCTQLTLLVCPPVTAN